MAARHPRETRRAERRLVLPRRVAVRHSPSLASKETLGLPGLGPRVSRCRLGVMQRTTGKPVRQRPPQRLTSPHRPRKLSQSPRPHHLMAARADTTRLLRLPNPFRRIEPKEPGRDRRPTRRRTRLLRPKLTTRRGHHVPRNGTTGAGVEPSSSTHPSASIPRGVRPSPFRPQR
jgi:hypothetical protein